MEGVARRYRTKKRGVATGRLKGSSSIRRNKKGRNTGLRPSREVLLLRTLYGRRVVFAIVKSRSVEMVMLVKSLVMRR